MDNDFFIMKKGEYKGSSGTVVNFASGGVNNEVQKHTDGDDAERIKTDTSTPR